jgi:hypothetical protein
MSTMPGDILNYNALNWPERVCVVADGRKITFAEMQTASWRLSNALADLGEHPHHGRASERMIDVCRKSNGTTSRFAADARREAAL